MESLVGSGKASRILVIKLSALGDMVHAMSAFQGIRRAHAEDEVVLLTRPPYRGLADACGCFDRIWTNGKPCWWRPWERIALNRQLRQAGFSRVYDLQWSSLSNRTYRALASTGLEWVGVAPGCSHFYAGRRDHKHIETRQAEMLALASIDDLVPGDFGFLQGDRAAVPSGDFALIAPGSAANRTVKRWPLESFIEICRRLVGLGLDPVIVGGAAEAEAIAQIRAACPEARHYKTDLGTLAEFGRAARVAIGNDTGPIHLFAALGCPTFVLFGPEGIPEKNQPLGPVQVLWEDSLDKIGVQDVFGAIETALEQAGQESKEA